MTSRHRHAVEVEVKNVSRYLKAIDRSFRRLAPMLTAAVSMNGASKTNGRSRPRLSARARATMLLQGRYMGYMRQLKPRQKAQVRKKRATQGVRAAIAEARQLAVKGR